MMVSPPRLGLGPQPPRKITPMDDTILRSDDLRVVFEAPEGTVKAVNGVSFSLKRGSTLAVFGEGGAGKTTLALAILRLLPYSGRIVQGHIYYEGRDLLALSGEEMRRLRGREKIGRASCRERV